jgi:hypothetical protein
MHLILFSLPRFESWTKAEPPAAAEEEEILSTIYKF